MSLCVSKHRQKPKNKKHTQPPQKTKNKKQKQKTKQQPKKPTTESHLFQKEQRMKNVSNKFHHFETEGWRETETEINRQRSFIGCVVASWNVHLSPTESTHRLPSVSASGRSE